MTVYLGADHGGFELKEALKKHLDAEGYKLGCPLSHSISFGAITVKKLA